MFEKFLADCNAAADYNLADCNTVIGSLPWPRKPMQISRKMK